MIFRQPRCVDSIPTRVNRAEVGKIERIAIGYSGVTVDPRFERRQVLSPVQRAIDQMLIAAARTTGNSVEVSEVIWPARNRFTYLSQQKNRNYSRDERAAIFFDQIENTSAGDEQHRINR